MARKSRNIYFVKFVACADAGVAARSYGCPCVCGAGNHLNGRPATSEKAVPFPRNGCCLAECATRL